MSKPKTTLDMLIESNLDMPEEKLPHLPRGFQVVGKIAILKLNPEIQGYSREIADLILKTYPYLKTVCLSKGVSGELRKPKITYLAGDRATETIHRENNCRYKLDVKNVMFSQGNLFERSRIQKLVLPGETVIDMFAGIGYFSIPIAMNSKPRKVYSIEKNPDSFLYLKENIKLNQLSRKIVPINSDCRNPDIKQKADRILMGYFPGTSKYLPSAFSLLKESGGTIHYHDTIHKDDLWEKPIKALENEGKKASFSLDAATHKRKVKDHSPNVYHIVIDAKFS